ncbi:MAG: alpha/beta fold hydrolase [Deltaproteobacteria bacterium]|nr:alpha/beta fold hydrolase [Deltaproteobacteria bacterium]
MTHCIHRYAHLHGFASSSRSQKGTYLAGRLAARGRILELPELNVPSFAELTYGGALAALDELEARAEPAPPFRWRLSGSSMGGYLAARWAELHPARVDRLVLLCPAFDLIRRWEEQVGAATMQRWQEQGFLELPDADGRLVPVHWRFVEEARRHPPYPEVGCPTLILHGRQDESVPIESSREYAAARPHVQLVELDDDHRLLGSLERIGDEVERFFAHSCP